MSKKKVWDKENKPVTDPKYLNYRQSVAYAKGKMSEEERRIHEENLEHRDRWDYRGVKAMQSAICYQAVADYRAAKEHKIWAERMLEAGGNREVYTEILEECKSRIADCRRFFKDDLFQSVVHVRDIDQLCQMIENERNHRRTDANVDLKKELAKKKKKAKEVASA